MATRFEREARARKKGPPKFVLWPVLVLFIIILTLSSEDIWAYRRETLAVL
jgi:hypothetical protein